MTTKEALHQLVEELPGTRTRVVNYRVVIAHEAEKVLDRMDRPTERRIRTRVVQLAADPFDSRLSAPLTERPACGSRELADGAFSSRSIATRE
jgi:mRNA-degrading endonuclease RelE of RelBE toxin-antitoxin system